MPVHTYKLTEGKRVMTALKTRRAQDHAQVAIDHEKCNLCGLCVEVCKGNPLYIENERVMVDQNRLFGCVGCGQCTAICPQNCISVTGRTLKPEDFYPIPKKGERAGYEQLSALLAARRSIRNFKKEEVSDEHINKILEAASTAPMGLPPSEVEVFILKGFARVNEFASDAVDYFLGIKWMFSSPMLLLYRPFIGKEAYDLFKSFMQPLPNVFNEARRKGQDWLLYDAPLAIYFYSSPTSDPADPLIPATYAMLAAESLGLGTCMIGSIGPFLKYKNKLTRKYGIPPRHNTGVFLIIGHPRYKYQRAVKRSFARVTYWE